jgi:hypothetical protein
MVVVADTENYRVLVWNHKPAGFGDLPDVVLGQTALNSIVTPNSPDQYNFVYPEGVFCDGTHLFVADLSFHRVLAFRLPLTTHQAAEFVVGQSTLTSSFGPIDAAHVDSPSGVWSDGCRLIVADNVGNRVLIYNQIPTADGALADVVVGQTGMTTESSSSPPSSTSLRSPSSVTVANGNLVVYDTGTRRVLIYNGVPSANNAAASVVIGQANMTSIGAPVCTGSTSIYDSSAEPDRDGLSFDGRKLYVQNGGRILIYDPLPGSSGALPTTILSQRPSCDPAASNDDAHRFGFGNVAATACGSRLYVADGIRVGVFDCGGPVCTGCANFTSEFDGGYAQGLSVDGISGDIYVTDPSANEVRQYLPSGSPGIPFGTPGLLNNPEGIHVDGFGSHHIFVADTGNHRVVEFTSAGATFNSWPTGSLTDHIVDVATDSFGNVYTVDDTPGVGPQVKKFSPMGVPVPGGSWSLPSNAGGTSISINALNELYVTTDSTGPGLVKYSLSGVLSPVTFSTPGYRVEVDLNGDPWVVDPVSLRVKHYNSSGTLICAFGAKQVPLNDFQSPGALDFDSNGNLYVVQEFGGTVLKFHVCSLDPSATPGPTPTPAGLYNSSAKLAPREVKTADFGLSASKPLITFPNPAKNLMRVAFLLEKAASVRLILTDLSGVTVGTLELGTQAAGQGVADFNVSSLASGIYFVVLQVDEGMGFVTKSVKKAAIVK